VSAKGLSRFENLFKLTIGSGASRFLSRIILSSWGVALVLLSVTSGAASSPTPPAVNEVKLPLAEYLALVEKGDKAERERAAATARREAPVAEIVTQKTAVSLPEGTEEAELTARYEAVVQGHPTAPLLLPFAGLSIRAEVHSLSGSGGALPALAPEPGRGLLLVAPAPGRYAIEVHGRAALADREGVRRLVLAPVAAPVAEVALELPADLAWSAPGAVAVEDQTAGGRRAVRLAVERGEAQVLEIQRRLGGTEAEKLLAQSVVLTLFQLRPDGLRRHDVVLYEVSRGSLETLAVELPADLAVEQVATDEGDVVPVVEARILTVHRRRQLQGVGYLVLSSTPRSGAALPARSVDPAGGIEVRARYLAVASSVAAEVAPQPAVSWSRVDLSDLPKALGEALQTLDLSAAWRYASPVGSAATPAEPGLGIAFLPTAPRLATLVRRRETTTLLTVDGTLLHRDRFTLDQAGVSLDLTLPAGAVLWSVQVGGQAVRPVERGGGLSVPLGFLAGVAGKQLPVVEVVSVLERKVPKGRSQLALDLPQVGAPVVEHQWRLLLPEGARYRFQKGELQPVHEVVRFVGGNPAQSVLTDRINVGGNEKGQQSSYQGPKDKKAASYFDFDNFAEQAKVLKQGLVGGVKPLPITIPETGKVLLLAGALPPVRVGVALDVKGKR